MFWNWASAAQRRFLAVRAANASDAIRLAFETGSLEGAPEELVGELLAATRQLAAVAPAQLATAVEDVERLVERMRSYCGGAAPQAASDGRAASLEASTSSSK